jgi:tetratricopeptide (TPR) repeat protein
MTGRIICAALLLIALAAHPAALAAAAQAPASPAAPAAGTLPLTGLPAGAREAFFASIDAAHQWAWVAADEHATRALALDSTFGLARVYRNELRALGNQHAEARRGTADAAGRSVPEMTFLLGLRADGVNAARLLGAARAMFPNDRRIALDQALQFAGAERIDSLRALAGRFPEMPAPKVWLAYYMTPTQGTVYTPEVATEALRAAQEAVRIAPNLAGAHSALGHVLHRMRRYDEALTHLAQAIRLDPRAEYAYVVRSEIFMDDGKPNGVDRARAALDSAYAHSVDITRRHGFRRTKAILLLHDGKAREMTAELEALAREAERNAARPRACPRQAAGGGAPSA